MPDSLLRIVAALLGATFAWAAVAKLARWGRWRDALRGYELPAGLATTAAPAVPLLEIAVAVLVVLGRTHLAGALSIVLLSGFSGALLYAQARRGDKLPCGCFGRATERDYRLMLARNALLGALAAALLVASGDVSLGGVSAPGADDVLPALLVVVGIALGVWIVRHASSLFDRRGSS